MEPYDWNHNGKHDFYDDMMQYEANFGPDKNEHNYSGGGGMSTFTAIFLTAISMIASSAICVLLNLDGALQVIAFIIFMPIICAVLSILF